MAGRNERTLSKSNAINLSTVRPPIPWKFYGGPLYIKTKGRTDVEIRAQIAMETFDKRVSKNNNFWAWQFHNTQIKSIKI
jgi:hypothetical protein